MRVVVIVPARGGSKRVKNKNIRLLGNIPLIGHTIKEAVSCKKISDVYVTTDAEHIKSVSSQFGARVIDRPKSLCTDTSSTVSALRHAVQKIGLKNEDIVVLLQPTNPFRPTDLLENTLSFFKENSLNSLFSVSQNEHKLGQIKNNRFLPVNYSFGQRSQDMDKMYYENGLIYITRVSLINEGVIFDSTSYPYVVDVDFPIVDIDYEKDFRYAEYLLEREKL